MTPAPAGSEDSSVVWLIMIAIILAFYVLFHCLHLLIAIVSAFLNRGLVRNHTAAGTPLRINGMRIVTFVAIGMFVMACLPVFCDSNLVFYLTLCAEVVVAIVSLIVLRQWISRKK